MIKFVHFPCPVFLSVRLYRRTLTLYQRILAIQCFTKMSLKCTTNGLLDAANDFDLHALGMLCYRACCRFRNRTRYITILVPISLDKFIHLTHGFKMRKHITFPTVGTVPQTAELRFRSGNHAFSQSLLFGMVLATLSRGGRMNSYALAP